MNPHEGKPARTWQDIAAEASREKNPQRFMELTRELERTLEERDAKLRQQSKFRKRDAEQGFGV